MFPNLDVEKELLASFDQVIGIDEVGRGAIAGPVTVGLSLITSAHLATFPDGIKDSKLIPEAKRVAISERASAWAEVATGSVSAVQIENLGITGALAEAALLGLAELRPVNAVILLDGSANWLSGRVGLPVVMRTKADRDCGSVAAASVVAKVSRDAQMRQLHLEHPQYDWESNKGYASASHIAALRELGPTTYHRVSWLGKILTMETQLFD